MPTTWPRSRWTQRSAPSQETQTLNGPAIGLYPLLARLLEARGVTQADQASRFLKPQLTEMHDPAELPGCDRAARRMAQAVTDKQPIVIYGDYDVDGVTASAILYHTLKLAGAQVSTYVPHRLDEGYGLNEDAIRTLAGDGPTPLMISVDCGITATGPAAVARSLGVDLIITDHHHFDPEDLPDAYALVHPGLRDSQAEAKAEADHVEQAAEPYPNRDLCGAGVAYKLAWQFAKVFCGCADAGKKTRLPDAYRQLLLDLLVLAALGTVADVVPLIEENRVITAFGLSRIKKTQFGGLNALIDASNLRGEKIDSYHVGFVLGPRLNACGRMGHAREAVELLTTATGARAAELAKQLHQANEDRRATERAIVDQAIERVETQGYDREDTRAIVLADPGWHPGVVGIVASRLVDRFHRPAVLLCIDESTSTAKGSARSVDGVSIHAAIQACEDHISKFGGHEMAAGLTLPAENIPGFRQALIEQVGAMLKPDDMVQHVRIDTEITLRDCTPEVFDQIQRLAPFGRSNPKPRLRINALTLDRPAARMGSEGRHLSMNLKSADGSIRAVAWNMGDLAEDLPAGVRVDVVAQPAINDWRGRRSAELHIVDLRIADR